MRLAVLIDGDNVSAKTIDAILVEVAALGTASIKRIYGDFTKPHFSSWNSILPERAIQPVQQFANSVGKNATDSALIIDAMDLLHQKSMDGFCLVSSDADFTRLATRIREDGLEVYGFGATNTPKAFIKACSRFFKIDLPTDENKVKPIPAPAKPSTPVKKQLAHTQEEALQKIVEKALEAAAPKGSRASLSEVGNHLSRLMPDFDCRKYGHRKLSELVATVPGFKVDGAGKSLTVGRK